MTDSVKTVRKVGKVDIAQMKLTWRIDKISESCNISEIQSSVFHIKTNGETKCQLLLRPGGDKVQNFQDDESYLSILLRNLSTESLRATVQFSILHFSNTEVNFRRFVDQELKPHNDGGCPNFVKQGYLFNKKIPRVYSLDDSFTIVCRITVNEFIKVEIKKAQTNVEQSLRLAQFDKLGNLYDDKRFSDVVIEVEGKEIHAHKIFLANQSPVFEAMFTHNMLESNSNRVKISDLNYCSVHGMLRYIYTGIVIDYGSLQEPYKDILKAAEKYGIANLKLECEEKLSVLLSNDNIFEYLKFSDTNNATYLKKNVIDYIVDHGEDIAALPSFKKHCSELHADVVSEVFRAFAVKKRKLE